MIQKLFYNVDSAYTGETGSFVLIPPGEARAYLVTVFGCVAQMIAAESGGGSAGASISVQEEVLDGWEGSESRPTIQTGASISASDVTGGIASGILRIEPGRQLRLSYGAAGTDLTDGSFRFTVGVCVEPATLGHSP